MSFGWSAGDVVSGVKLLYDVGDVVANAEKAPDEVKRADKTSRAIEDSLEHAKTVFTPGQPNDRAREIRAQAQDSAAQEKEHRLKRYKRYGDKLGRDVARRRMRAWPEKIRWRLQGKKDEESHQKSQQGSIHALQTDMLAYVANRQTDHLQLAKNVLAQGEAHFHSVVKSTTDTGTAILRRLDESDHAIQQQQQVLERAIEMKLTKLDDILAFVQQQSVSQRSREELLENYLQRLEPLIENKINELGLSQKASGPREEAITNPTPSLGRCTSRRATSTGGALESTTRISVLRVGGRSVEFAWQEYRTSAKQAALAISVNEGAVYLTVLLIILAACCEIGLELGRYVSSQTSKRCGISAPVSFLLPDNIYFTDALGREFRLCLDQSSTWEMLVGWLREQFKGCPGSSKVESGHFFIFDPRDPDRVISGSTWSKVVGPRRRFQMGIVLSHTQLPDHCRRCVGQGLKKPLVKDRGEFNVRCPTCGTLYSSSALGPLRRRFSVLATSLFKEYGDHRSRSMLDPGRAIRSARQSMQYLTQEFARMNKEPASDVLDLDLEPEMERSHLHAGLSWNDEKDASTIAYSHWRQEDYSEDPEEEPVVHGPLPDTLQETDDEQKDIEYFKAMWVNSDTRLLNAALQGNCELARKLIFEGHDPNQKTGQSGSPLIAAIVSDSPDTVKLLLDHGADPLLPVQQGYTPVSVAACHATESAGYLLFPAAFRASYHEPAAFQSAVDRALYESTTKEHEWHDFLLFIGANPVAPCPGPRQSAFAKALKAKDVALLKRFLMVLWERQVLSSFEATVLVDTVEGGKDAPLGTNPDPWLRVCCAALKAGDPEVLVREAGKLIQQKPDFYFRLNISCNMRPHSDMQRFWRDCENERKSIVIPFELRGMAA